MGLRGKEWLPTTIKVYTANEIHGTVGSKIKLSCTFWSNEWISDDISITWHFQPERGKDRLFGN
uniref:Myelin protein zero n=1 Tax=Pseudonaja textilis TaxID=8673 RepID=A0A670YNI3_PSETE